MTAVLTAALGAGIVSLVNPCGFAMLPAYLGIFLGTDTRPSLRRFISVAGSVSAGFIVVFSLAGVVISLGLRSAIGLIPWLAAGVGVILVILGIGVLTDRLSMPSIPVPGRANRSGTFRGMFGFGITYAIASLSCTLPIFLSLIAGTIAGGSFGEAVVTFVAYGVGMALALTAVTIAVGFGHGGLVGRIRGLSKHVHVVSGVALILAGGFIVWYWVTVLSVGSVALGSNGLVRAVDEVSAFLTGLVARNPLITGLVLLAVVGAGVVASRSRRRSTSNEPDRLSTG